VEQEFYRIDLEKHFKFVVLLCRIGVIPLALKG